MSLLNQRLKYKLIIMVAVMTVIPVLFLLYIILQFAFPSLRLIPGQETLKISIIIGLIGILGMSLAGILLMYRSIRSLEDLTRKTETAFRENYPQQIKELVTKDETEKIAHYFTNLLMELQNKMQMANQYALDLAEANRKLTNLALKDGLTNLYNQAYIKERLNQEFTRAQKFNRVLSLLMLDIDDFKKYNDTYGHLRGDEALQKTARLIRNNLRPTDIPARYGGEEFLVILPETEPTLAQQIAERIRTEMAQYQFGITLKDRDKSLTVSIGLTSYPNSVQTSEELIAQADHALYQAKKSGKNQVKTNPCEP